jgi:hypothetical protein
VRRMRAAQLRRAGDMQLLRVSVTKKEGVEKCLSEVKAKGSAIKVLVGLLGTCLDVLRLGVLRT